MMCLIKHTKLECVQKLALIWIIMMWYSTCHSSNQHLPYCKYACSNQLFLFMLTAPNCCCICSMYHLMQVCGQSVTSSTQKDSIRRWLGFLCINRYIKVCLLNKSKLIAVSCDCISSLLWFIKYDKWHSTQNY